MYIIQIIWNYRNSFIKQKYIIFRTNLIILTMIQINMFYNKDITIIDKSKILLNNYIEEIEIDRNKYEPIGI